MASLKAARPGPAILFLVVACEHDLLIRKLFLVFSCQFNMAALEFLPHGAEHLLREGVVLSRAGSACTAQRSGRRPERLLRAPPLTVHRPSPESCTMPVYSESVGFSARGHRREIQQPGRNHAATPPDFGDIRQSSGRTDEPSGKLRWKLALRKISKALSIGLHQPILDAVVHR